MFFRGRQKEIFNVYIIYMYIYVYLCMYNFSLLPAKTFWHGFMDIKFHLIINDNIQYTLPSRHVKKFSPGPHLYVIFCI